MDSGGKRTQARRRLRATALAARGEVDPLTIQEKVGSLVDAWCDRRALHPLRLILRGYPLVSGPTDDWAALLDSLSDVRAMCQSELPEAERRQVEACIVATEPLVYR